jgi:hypothetical protein
LDKNLYGFEESLKENLQLLAHNVSEYKEVFIAEWLEGDGIFVQTYNTRKKVD